MKIKIISFIAASLFLLSCENTSGEKSKEQTETATSAEHHHDGETETIQLNNGEKWNVDTPMLLHIRKMESDVLAFGQAEQKDYDALTAKLQTNIDLLTSGCTMKGQAHDELHKWLLPYINLVNELSEAKDETEAAKHFEIIKASFVTFNQYFQ